MAAFQTHNSLRLPGKAQCWWLHASWKRGSGRLPLNKCFSQTTSGSRLPPEARRAPALSILRPFPAGCTPTAGSRPRSGLPPRGGGETRPRLWSRPEAGQRRRCREAGRDSPRSLARPRRHRCPFTGATGPATGHSRPGLTPGSSQPCPGLQLGQKVQERVPPCGMPAGALHPALGTPARHRQGPVETRP